MKTSEKPNYEKFQVLEVKEDGFKELVSGTINTNKMIKNWPYKVVEAYLEYTNTLVVVKIGFSYYSLITTE